MKLTVIDAAGPVGRQVVNLALATGHEVTGVLLSDERPEVVHERLRLLPARIIDGGSLGGSLGDALHGADAVISAVDPTAADPAMMIPLADAILRGMKRYGARRLVDLVSPGVPDARGRSRALEGFTLVRSLRPVTEPEAMARPVHPEMVHHAELIRASRVDWTMVRPARLIDGIRTGRYRHGYLRLGIGASIFRADLADFLVALAVGGGYLRRAPIVSYAAKTGIPGIDAGFR